MNRYERQLIVPEIGKEGQKKLADGSVLVIGAGGLGSAVLFSLAGAGVGTLGIVDGDTVSLSNLNRQYLYTQNDLNKKKAICAKNRLNAFNPEISLRAFPVNITPDNAGELIQDFSVVVLAVDNIETRLLVNRVCQKQKKPLISGGVNGWDGDLMTVLPGKTACLRCLYQNIPEAKGDTPSIGAVVSAIGSLQATAVLHLLLNATEETAGKLLCFDARHFILNAIPISRLPDCEDCI